jgi:DNA-binding CsgD family transcriptional regulator
MLLQGRLDERHQLDRQLQRARAGQSSVRVLRGEAGVGKTALLDYVAERAVGCRIARTAGVQSEMELAFAGLHQLCAPLVNGLDRLPAPQRDALRVAFGLQDGGAPDRFLVALAVLGLLADAAETRPLVCLVDDAQWLDRTSAQTLAFVARRLLAERIVMVFAVRDPGDADELTGLPELTVEGINDSDARVLLESGMPGLVDERVRDRIVAETRGNPLALLELPRGLTPAELAGGFGLPGAGSLSGRMEQNFLRRFGSLPSESQRLLLTAAAEPVGDVTLIWRAAGRLGIGGDAVKPAEAGGLITFGSGVRFRHPLVRSAIYRAAAPDERQEVHRALAAETDPEADPDRRAWHRAHATTGLDESVAADLERSADRARGRGGVAAAAAFLEHAAELTPDPARRGARALAAAQAKLEAGAPEAAHALLAIGDLSPLDELQRARSQRLQARIAFAVRRGSDAPPLLLDAAERLVGLDPQLARETYLEALAAAMFAGRLGSGRGMAETAVAARAAPRAPQPPRAIDLLLDGLAMRFSEGYAAGVPQLKRALSALSEEESLSEDDTRWLWLACRVAPDLWDDEAWHQLATLHVRVARDTGALTVLPVAMTYRAGVHVHAGAFAAAAALVEEAAAITEAIGSPPLSYTSLVLAAWRGHGAGALELIQTSIADAASRGEGRAVTLAEYATAVLYNGLGRYKDALAAAQRACEHDELGLFGWALIELVEAGSRTGQPEVAATALGQLDERTRSGATEWALGIQARSRALLTSGPAAEALYREGIERLARSRIRVHLARAHLVYGEWLRRENRRLDAREALHLAHELFSDIGAEGFAERARRELAATGETARKRTVDTLDALTPQEAQIALLAGNRRTNPEIGAELFISPRTVEYHLHKVFQKLGVSSRRELRQALDRDAG